MNSTAPGGLRNSGSAISSQWVGSKGTGGGRVTDRLTDFTIGSDKLDLLSTTGAPLPAPRAFSRASNSAATNLAAVVAAVFTDADGATAGNQRLATNSAALVLATAPAIAGAYLVVNDAAAGFQASDDLVVNLSGLSGTLPALGSVPVGAWFA